MKPSHPGNYLPSHLSGSVSAAGSSTKPVQAVLVDKVKPRKCKKKSLELALRRQ